MSVRRQSCTLNFRKHSRNSPAFSLVNIIVICYCRSKILVLKYISHPFIVRFCYSEYSHVGVPNTLRDLYSRSSEFFVRFRQYQQHTDVGATKFLTSQRCDRA